MPPSKYILNKDKQSFPKIVCMKRLFFGKSLVIFGDINQTKIDSGQKLPNC